MHMPTDETLAAIAETEHPKNLATMPDDFFETLDEGHSGLSPTIKESIARYVARCNPSAAFLALLGADIKRNPQRLQPFTPALLARIKALIGSEDIDLNAPLLPEDDD